MRTAYCVLCVRIAYRDLEGEHHLRCAVYCVLRMCIAYRVCEVCVRCAAYCVLRMRIAYRACEVRCVLRIAYAYCVSGV